MVVAEAVMQLAELQKGGAVVVAKPRRRREILDGFLWISHPDVALCAELPRLRIPRRDLEEDGNFL